MRLVVTFCNQHSTPPLSVCVVDVESDTRAWLPVPDSFGRGAAGIATIGGDLFIACQPGGLVRYDARLEPAETIPTPGARNLHSLHYRPAERALYVVATQNDTLYRYRFDDAESRVVAVEEVFCADPERAGRDRVHLNSVGEWNGDLYVTMFGPAGGPTHRDRRNGQVVRVDDGAVVVDGLHHPHSVFGHGDELLVVESQTRLVRRVAGGPEQAWEIPGGYPRGIADAEGGRVWVGVSALRRKSESQGTTNVLSGTTPLDFRTRVVELDLAAGRVVRDVDLTHLAREVFDVRVLDPGLPFVPSATGGLAERVDALEASFDEQRAARQAIERSSRSLRDRLADDARRARRKLRSWARRGRG